MRFHQHQMALYTQCTFMRHANSNQCVCHNAVLLGVSIYVVT